jgi:hypothetical protein
MNSNPKNLEQPKTQEINNSDYEVSELSDCEIEKVKSKEFTYFGKIFKLMIKMINDDDISENDLDLEPKMKLLFIEFLKKKKLISSITPERLTKEKLMELKNKENNRRTEERLKFVFKKCIKYIQNKFKLQLIENGEYKNIFDIDSNFSDSVKFDYIFYNHYFKKIADEINQPIEKFFHFRNWKNRTSEHIPKSITKVYVNYLKMNKKFMNMFINYIEKRLVKDVTLNNLYKVSRLVEEWEDVIKKRKVDINEGIDFILKTFKRKSLKLPWGLNEVNIAIKDTYNYIMKE